MAKRIFTREIKDYVYDEIDRRGSITVDEVAEIIRALNVYDPMVAEERWYRDQARRLMAQRRDAGGMRVLFAPRTAESSYINIETCKDINQVRAVLRQLEEKRDGLNASLAKARRRAAELEGQIRMDEIVNQDDSASA